MSKSLYLFTLLWCVKSNGYTQHQDVHDKPFLWRGLFHAVDDSSTILNSFRQGQVNGHFRHFFMATDNSASLTDYYANAFGAALRFETAQFHGLQMTLGGSFVENLGSSDLSTRDAMTNAANRYEIGLFNMEDPSSGTGINRLEEFNLKYNWRTSFIEAGKILVNTPMINLQDGRMRPTLSEGVWVQWNEARRLRLEGGFLYGFSPRGTTGWYRGARSIGAYPAGLNPDGSKSGYKGNLKSHGVGVVGMVAQPASGIELKLWNYYVSQIINSVLVQADFNNSVSRHSSGDSSASSSRPIDGFYGGIQFIRQDALAYGGNPDQSKTYTPQNSKAMTFGAQAGWKNTTWDFSINYNRITSRDRYLFPREWGRDPFYTFMPRERNDGLADVHSGVLRAQWKKEKYGIRSGLAAGYFNLSDVRDFAMNKYGMPSYYQINLDIGYASKGLLKGMETQLLIVSKIKNGETYGEMRYVIHKVNMVLYNLVINYHF